MTLNGKLLIFNNLHLVDIRYTKCYTSRVMKHTAHTEQHFRKMLATDERWVRRALIRLYQRQTASEQASEQTHNHNLQGFQPCDARWFSRLAQYATRFPDRPLSAKQLAIARRPWRGEPAICKYSKQLMAIAAADAQAKQPAAPARKFSDCERCGEELPECRCKRKADYATWEADQERKAFMAGMI